MWNHFLVKSDFIVDQLFCYWNMFYRAFADFKRVSFLWALLRTNFPCETKTHIVNYNPPAGLNIAVSYCRRVRVCRNNAYSSRAYNSLRYCVAWGGSSQHCACGWLCWGLPPYHSPLARPRAVIHIHTRPARKFCFMVVTRHRTVLCNSFHQLSTAPPPHPTFVCVSFVHNVSPESFVRVKKRFLHKKSQTKTTLFDQINRLVENVLSVYYI